MRRHAPRRSGALLLGALLMLPIAAPAYPLDAYAETGIGRLEAQRRVEAGELPGEKQPPGAKLPRAAVDLRLLGHRDLDLPPPDPGFSRQIAALLGENADRYAISVLDLSDPARPRYAEHRGDVSQNPGSVGKLLVILAWMQALADLYPGDTAKRWAVLRDTVVTADDFVNSDHHTVRLWDPRTQTLTRRSLAVGDRGSLLEFMDWMISASSNSAASAVMREGLLLRAFGKDYPPRAAVGRDYLLTTRKSALSAALAAFLEDPEPRNGLDPKVLRQGTFFTRTGQHRVPGKTSYATTRELMKYVLRLEQGRLVDEFSSREIKRLMYQTERRIRYASSPALTGAAVYYKSGSLFECKPEPDFACKAYAGNVKNFMNSVAIVESPARERRLFYLVTLLSNVLRRNSAEDHQEIATRIQRLIESLHPAAGLVDSGFPQRKKEGLPQAAPIRW